MIYDIHFSGKAGDELKNNATISIYTVDFDAPVESRFTKMGEVKLAAGNFTLNRKDSVNGVFNSNIIGLHLKNCSSPLPAGFSIGN